MELSPFPALTTPPFGPTSYELTAFQSNTVLTAPQLNAWFSFAMAQDQATRARLLGVGVATGLVPRLTTDAGVSSITLPAGCGVTTEGHLLRLETDQTYLSYSSVPFVAADYAPFYQNVRYFDAIALNEAGTLETEQPVRKIRQQPLKMYELLPAGTTGGQPLSNLRLSDYAVVLFQESVQLPIDRCGDADCQDKGSTYTTRLRVLLALQADAANQLLLPGPVQAATAYSQLPPLEMLRPWQQQVTRLGTSHAARLQSLKDFLRTTASTFGTRLLEAGALVRHISGFRQDDFVPLAAGQTRPRLGPYLSYVEDWQTQLINRVTQLTQSMDANSQYLYDWLKDLHAAYEEFRQAMADPEALGQSMPAATAFARHLVLGELAPTTCAVQYRHAWQPAPAVVGAPDALARAVWLFRRIGTLIAQFNPPALLSSVPAKGTLESIDRTLEAQEFFTVRANTKAQTLADLLALEKSVQTVETAQTETATASRQAVETNLFLDTYTSIYTYPADPVKAALTPVAALRITPDRGLPASFDQRSLPFYYNDALRTGWSYAKTTNCRAAHVVSYTTPPAGTPDHLVNPLKYQLDHYDFFRIEGLLDAPAANVLGQLTTLREQYNLPFDVVAVRADADIDSSLPQPLLAPLEGKLFADQQVEFEDLLIQVEEAEVAALAQRSTFVKLAAITTPAAALDLALPAATFTQKLDAYKLANTNSAGVVNLPVEIRQRLDLLTGLKDAYTARLTELSNQLDFLPFLQANPGLEHGAGVPRGGTFVLVYRALATASRTVPVVVGDYYLPYRLGSRGLTVKFELPTPAPTLSVANPVCVKDTDVRLDVTPAGGHFTDTMVSIVNGNFYFHPNLVTMPTPPATPPAAATSAAYHALHTLTYLLPTAGPDPLTVSKTVCVLPEPQIISLVPTVAPSGLVTFAYEVVGATSLLMEFGDDSTEGFLLNVLPEQNNSSSYYSFFRTPHDFAHKYANTRTLKAKLTAKQGTRTATFTVEVAFAAVQTTITGEPAIFVKQKSTLQLVPASGGLFATDASVLNAADNKPLSSALFYTTQPGEHTIKYTANNSSQEFTFFALPSDFVPKDFDFDYEQLVGSVPLVIIPDKLSTRFKLEWRLGQEPLRPGTDYDVKKLTDKLNSYDFHIRNPGYKEENDVPNLLLYIYDSESESNTPALVIERDLFPDIKANIANA
jgi:hypothetical protein